MNRRNFLEVTSMGTAALASSLILPSFDDKKLKVGLIGAGWYGMVISKAALNVGGVEITGVCDVDSGHLESSASELQKLQGLKPATFRHYQDLLDMKDIEAVFIATPPHWHALQFIAACEKGLDIYCEKPLSYDVAEGLAMVNAAKKAGNIIQIGFQRRQSEAFRKAKSMISGGKIGKVLQIDARIHYIPEIPDNTIQAPPATLDWDEWCGPAPKLEYRPSIGHKAWRLEKEYGNGHLVDWGIHHIDIIRTIMDEGMPQQLFSTGGNFKLKDKITTPDTLTTDIIFGKVPLLWQHRLWGTGDVTPEFNNGIFFYGDEGTMFADDSRILLFASGKDRKREELSLPSDRMQENHMDNFLKAVRSKDKNMIDCSPADAFQSTATVQLAMISYYTGTTVNWNKDTNTVIDNPAAAAKLKRAYRGKYVHP